MSSIVSMVGAVHGSTNGPTTSGPRRPPQDRNGVQFASNKKSTGNRSFNDRNVLAALVDGHMPRSRLSPLHKAAKKIANLGRRRRSIEKRQSVHAARELIDDDSYPPAKRPAKRPGVRKPRHPEAARRGNSREVDVPDVVGILRSAISRRTRWSLFFERQLAWVFLRLVFLDHPPHRGRSKLQTRSGKRLSDPDLAHRRTHDLQTPNEAADVIRELVHRLADLKQAPLTFFVGRLRPRSDGLLGDQKKLRDLRRGPTSCRLQLQDPHPVNRPVVRSTSRRHAAPPGVLDAQLFRQEGDLGLRSLQTGDHSYFRASVPRCPAPSRRQRGGGHRSGVYNARPDSPRPAPG